MYKRQDLGIIRGSAGSWSCQRGVYRAGNVGNCEECAQKDNTITKREKLKTTTHDIRGFPNRGRLVALGRMYSLDSTTVDVYVAVYVSCLRRGSGTLRTPIPEHCTATVKAPPSRQVLQGLLNPTITISFNATRYCTWWGCISLLEFLTLLQLHARFLGNKLAGFSMGQFFAGFNLSSHTARISNSNSK